MESPRFGISSTRFLLNSLLVVSLVPAGTGAGSVLAQSKRVVSDRGSTILINTYDEIPEATEPCTPAECEWWTQIRKAGNDLQRKGDEKSKTRFALLFSEGMQKAYHIPLKDRPPQVLAHGRVVFSDIAIKIARLKQMNRTAVLSVEYRTDGSVGDVKLVTGLGSGVDENVIQATRQNLFLPAIKNGAFVTDRVETEFGFYTRRRH